MTGRYTHETTIEIGGAEFDIVVEFDIESFSTPDDWSTGGGSNAEITIQSVYYCDDYEKNGSKARDILPVLETLRDLRLEYTTRRWYPASGLPQHEPYKALSYGFGFDVRHGYFSQVARGDWRGYVAPEVKFNQGRTLLDAVESITLDYVHEHESDFHSDPYDY